VSSVTIQEEDKQSKNTTKRDTGNTRHTRYRRKTILVTLETQDTGGRKTKQKYTTERYW
jgi:hypothetical protein